MRIMFHKRQTLSGKKYASVIKILSADVRTDLAEIQRISDRISTMLANRKLLLKLYAIPKQNDIKV